MTSPEQGTEPLGDSAPTHGREKRPGMQSGQVKQSNAVGSGARADASTTVERTPKAVLSPLPTETGIHVYSAGMSDVILEPSTYSAGKTSNILGSALTYGLSKAKLKAVILGPTAAIRTTDANAEFYFVFERESANLSASGTGWSALTSPNEFTLLRLDAKSKTREVTTASFGTLGMQTGTDNKALVPFTFTRLKPGVYRVVPKSPLGPGEYGFFPAAMGGQGTMGAQRLFDFGVDPR